MKVMYLTSKSFVSNWNKIWMGITRLPENCECGIKFTVEHALSCTNGGFVSIRHNSIRNITAILLKEVCHDV